MPVFDKEQIYDTEIYPLMSRLIEVCKKNQMPMIASFCYRHSEDNSSDYCTTILSGPGNWEPDIFKASLQLIREGLISFAITRGEI